MPHFFVAERPLSMHRSLSAFLAFGLPFLLGYGVLPLPHFINEMAAGLGLGLLLVVAAPRLAATRLSRAWWMAMVSLGVLLGLVGWQAWRSQAIGAGELYGLDAAYLAMAALAFHLGFACGRDPQEREAWLNRVLVCIAAAAVLAALAGLAQYFGLPLMAGLVPGLMTPGRAYGFLRQPNHQAIFLALGLMALLALDASGRWPRAWVRIFAIAVGAGVLAAGSRLGAGLLVLVLLGGSLVLGGRTRRLAFELAVVWAGVLAAMVWFHIQMDLPFHGAEKVRQTLGEGWGMRPRIWRETVAMIMQSPWLGVGLHRYAPIFLLGEGAQSVGLPMSHAHQWLLQLAFDFGVPAALLVALVMMRLLWGSRRALRQPTVAAAFGVVAILLLHSMVEFPLWYLHFLTVFAFMMGVLARADERSQQLAMMPMQRPWPVTAFAGRLLLMGAGGLIAAGAIWLNFDFYRVSPLFTPAGGLILNAHDQAQDVTWFRRYVRYAELAARPVDQSSAAVYWGGMQAIACLMPEPLYTSQTIVALGYLERIDEARRLLDLHVRLNPSRVAVLREHLRRHEGPTFVRLLDFLDHPYPVSLPPQRLLPCLQ